MKNTGEKDPLQTDDPWKPDHTQQEEATSEGEGASNYGDKKRMEAGGQHDPARRTPRARQRAANGSYTDQDQKIEARHSQTKESKKDSGPIWPSRTKTKRRKNQNDWKRKKKREMTLSESRRFLPR